MSTSISSTSPLVTMKGRKNGFILVLDENCAYPVLLAELKEKLSVNHQLYQEGPPISVKVEAGNRYLSPEHRDELIAVIRSYKSLEVEQIESNVMTRDEFENQEKKEQLISVAQIVRSGQELMIEGNVLLIGDVNPGGTIRATGNVYILGTLRGLACAGFGDNDSKAVVAASIMKPTQLRIGSHVSKLDAVGEQRQQEEGSDSHTIEVAYFDQEQKKIVIGKIQNVMKHRDLSTDFKRNS
ncbi:septum site-determining protein MinC [Sporolactobacillus spathodeae]|uniref:Probable septum site-determining protein MinC n=1 Tax=Sporolactobacillus spathodeae TaxID=1465502 RepID=A0ABS2Q900_9BACL|nr:septum site-determining protein MinC [Sporolactobacillus spathodeae]MBM7657447.1 septum site-determining protein MinC [Sporolactobacillus spathodeae]